MKYASPAEILPYSDRKYSRPESMPLDLNAIVQIQGLACDGKSRDAIYAAMAHRGVSMAQIARALDPKDEEVDARRKRLPQRANVGHAKMKERFR